MCSPSSVSESVVGARRRCADKWQGFALVDFHLMVTKPLIVSSVLGGVAAVAFIAVAVAEFVDGHHGRAWILVAAGAFSVVTVATRWLRGSKP